MSEIRGKVTVVLPVETGNKKDGTEWKKQSVVVGFLSGKFEKIVAIELWGDKVDTIEVGEEATFSTEATSREYAGKYYTTVSAWKIEKVAGSTASSKPSNNPPVSNFTEDDTLPF